ncbi:MAG TPA: hypothetical protein PKL88_01975 [bacterium]|nr:hypothetical protein [Patescibacteria group bacterium]HNU76460.1 hypothetical protein [bacterium]HPD73998.1 hypothetical protein [bacterium]
MRVYIGYKYRNFKDKEGLKVLLQKISDELSSLGHKTFILGRDEFEWTHHKRPSKSILPIIKNMRKNDVLFAVIECESKSNGLFIESLFATILGKKVILAVKEGVSPKPFSYFSKDVIEFENYDNLLVSVKDRFKNL